MKMPSRAFQQVRGGSAWNFPCHTEQSSPTNTTLGCSRTPGLTADAWLRMGRPQKGWPLVTCADWESLKENSTSSSQREAGERSTPKRPETSEKDEEWYETKPSEKKLNTDKKQSGAKTSSCWSDQCWEPQETDTTETTRLRSHDWKAGQGNKEEAPEDEQGVRIVRADGTTATTADTLPGITGPRVVPDHELGEIILIGVLGAPTTPSVVKVKLPSWGAVTRALAHRCELHLQSEWSDGAGRLWTLRGRSPGEMARTETASRAHRRVKEVLEEWRRRGRHPPCEVEAFYKPGEEGLLVSWTSWRSEEALMVRNKGNVWEADSNPTRRSPPPPPRVRLPPFSPSFSEAAAAVAGRPGHMSLAQSPVW